MFAHLQSRQNGFIEKVKLFNLAKENKDFIQRLKLDYKVEAHTGCVNTLCWSSSGQNILSGSDDQHLVITDPFKRKTVTSIRSGHRANIFSAKYLPFTGDNQIISCSGDGKIYYTKVGTGDQHEASLFDCHFGTTYEVIVVPNEASTFLSCGEDGTVRWFDLRIKTSCLKEDCKDDVLINCRRAVTSLAINPVLQYQLAIGCSDSSVRIFDRRMLGTRSSGHYTGRGLTGMICSFTAPNLASRSHRITSLSYSPNGGDVLVSYSSEYVYLFGTNDNRVKHYDKMFSKVEKCVERQSDPKPPQPAIQQPSTSNVIPLSSTSNLAALPSTSRPPPLPPKAPPKAQSTTTSLLAAASSGQASGGATEEEGYVQALTSEAYPDDQPEMSRQPPFKRLRMRGDWSDTGPNARPEAERNTEGRVRPPSIMQRMSDMLTRWLDGNLRRTADSTGEDQQETPQADEGMDSSTPQIPPSDQSQPGVSTEETIEMEGIVSGWSDMPSTSVSDSVGTNTDPTVCDETEHSEGQSVPSQENMSDVPESRSNPELTEIPSVSDNTHICDNSSDSRLSEDNSNIQQTSSVNSDNDQDSNREESHLEPVISLHYATEGTTSSTIRLGFARFENLEAGILQRSAENASLSPLVTEPASNQDQSGVLEDNVVQEASRLTEDIDSHDSDRVQENNNSYSESIQAENTHTITTGSELEQNTNLEVSEETAQHILSKPSQTDTLSDNTIQEQSETETRINETQSQPEVASPDEDIHDSSTWGQHSEERLDTPSMSSPISHLHIRPGSETDPGSLEGAESQMDTDIDSAQPPPLPRHRRIGRSGPSMGNIHLGLEMDNSDEEHEEETGGTRPTNRDSLERHITAIKLQELYRKRQEEKEKEEMEMRNVYRPSFKMKFKGHRNARTMIKEANFWGDDYVMSGSDCGHIFIWDRHTARLVMLLEGDRHVVNCLQPHPYDPILASSGIDYDIKIWAPLEECPNFNEDVSNEIMSRNEIMLEETRDTITVPAAFMLRVLASLNQIRAGRASVSRPSQEQGSSDSE